MATHFLGASQLANFRRRWRRFRELQLARAMFAGVGAQRIDLPIGQKNISALRTIIF